jgi:hypothetical protein
MVTIAATVLGAGVGETAGRRARAVEAGDPALAFHCCGLHEVAVTHRHGLRVDAQSSEAELDYLALLSRLQVTIGADRVDVHVQEGSRALMIVMSIDGRLSAWVAPCLLQRQSPRWMGRLRTTRGNKSAGC